MFTIAICDDEETICKQIEEIIMADKIYLEENIEIDIYYSGERLYDSTINGSQYDLIFLDIELVGLNGILIGRKIREELDDQTTQIVYISGKDKYDRQLFEVRPMHFLPKPIKKEKVIEDIILAMKLQKKNIHIFTYKIKGEINKILVKDIIYFQSVDRELRMVTVKGEELFYAKIKDVLSQVFKYGFLNIHRSYIINYAHVYKFKYDEVIMSNSDYLPISQSRRKEIKRLLIKYELENTTSGDKYI